MSELVRVLKKLKKEQAQSVIIKPADGTALAASYVKMVLESETQHIGWPRASSILKMCVRQQVIGYSLNLTKQRHLNARDRMIFGIGNAIHYWVQNTPDVLGDKRVGWWRCMACNNVIYFGGPPARNCLKCGARSEAITYHEHHLRGIGKTSTGDVEWMVTGHPDMFVKDGPQLHRVMELKSIGGADFDRMVAPLAEHSGQTQTYMWGCSEDENLPIKIDPDVGYVTYISKRNQTTQLPFKTFTIQRDERIIERIKVTLTLFKAGIQGFPKQLPEVDARCLKGGKTSSQARYCPVKDRCFAYYEEE